MGNEETIKFVVSQIVFGEIIFIRIGMSTCGISSKNILFSGRISLVTPKALYKEAWPTIEYL